MGKMYFAKMNINEDIFEVYEGKKKLNLNFQVKCNDDNESLIVV